MCTGLEIALFAATAVSAGASLLGSKKKKAEPEYTPPPAAVEYNPAALAANSARESGATVRIGDDEKKKTEDQVPEYEGFVEKRVYGKALGGLGRGGLGL